MWGYFADAGGSSSFEIVVHFVNIHRNMCPVNTNEIFCVQVKINNA
jgi:hypothetical protein